MKRQIIQRPGVGVTAHYIQRRRLLLHRVTIDLPSLVLVQRGAKTLRHQGTCILLRAGDAIAIAGGTSFDVTNQPDKDGVYEAAALVFDPQLIAEANNNQSENHKPKPTITPIRPAPPELRDAFRRTLEAIHNQQQVPQTVALHRAREVLAWLETLGGGFAPHLHESIARRVRTLLSTAPDQRWRAPQVARQLGMSEATLRRHLAAENQSLSTLLIEVRMSHALVLIQATDLPITQIALEVGYESAARFSARFRSRFGHPPSAIRKPDTALIESA